MLGERLSTLVSFEALKLAAGTVLLSPYVPLLFMGEEYGEESPFLYFVNHSDPDLVRAVREGRKAVFKSFRWQGEPPDPQSLETFLRSKLRWERRKEGKQKVLLTFYQKLIQLRKKNPALSYLERKGLNVFGIEKEKLLLLQRKHRENQVYCMMNFNPLEIVYRANLPKAGWKKIIDSAEERWMGPGSSMPHRIDQEKELSIKPLSFALYELEPFS
jgi:maltooligosyltrehalose trehalohydrolase